MKVENVKKQNIKFTLKMCKKICVFQKIAVNLHAN